MIKRAFKQAHEPLNAREGGVPPTQRRLPPPTNLELQQHVDRSGDLFRRHQPQDEEVPLAVRLLGVRQRGLGARL